MAEWLRLDPSELAAPHVEKHTDADVQIVYSMSPYDIPEAVRGEFDHQMKRFVIEFKYLQEEQHLETVGGTKSDPVRLRVGRRLGRLHRIEVDVITLRARSVALRLGITAALAKLAKNSEPLQSKNLRVAQEVVDKFGDQLLAPAGS